MPHRNYRTQVDIDRIHSHAVCDSIGERMRDELNRMPAKQYSSHLEHLMARLPELDDAESASIVPQIGN
jgi:hypothetical protein